LTETPLYDIIFYILVYFERGVTLIVLIAALVIITLIGIRFSRFHEDYMGVPQTTAIKGFFAVVILFSHMASYLNMTETFQDRLFASVMWSIGQLMVTLFFFYSGFGIMESYRKKGTSYYRSFIRTRLLKVLLHFDLAVLLFAVVNLILKIDYPVSQYITCWFAWDSIGNSNWFIFDTLMFYLITFTAMMISEETKIPPKLFCSVITVLCVLLWGVLEWTKGEPMAYWYNTILCFPLGLWYSEFKKSIDSLARKWPLWIAGLFLIGAVFAVLHAKKTTNAFCLCAPVFCLLITWITMKIRFNNKVLLWLGKYSFSIYIIQRIPMIILKHFGLVSNNILFSALSVITVFPLAFAFQKLLDVSDRLLFKKK